MRALTILIRASVLILLTGTWALCADTPVITEGEARALLEQQARAYTAKDLDAVIAMYDPDPNVVVIGAGVEERLRGLDQIRASYKREFEQLETVMINYSDISAASRGDVAWFAADCTALVDTGKEKFTVPGRFTGVLVRKDGKWLLVQTHFSIPVPPDEKNSEKRDQ